MMLILTFALATFDVIISVIRIAFLEQALLKKAVENRLYGSETPIADLDITFSESRAFMWSAVEVNIGIVCACILTLKPLVVKIFPTILEGSRRKHDSGGRSTRPESCRIEGISPASFRPNWKSAGPSSNGIGNASHLDPFISSSAASYANIEVVGRGVDRLAPGGNADTEQAAPVYHAAQAYHAAQLGQDLYAAVEHGVSVIHADAGTGHGQVPNSYAPDFITTPDMNNLSNHPGVALLPQNPEAGRRLFRCVRVHLPSKCINNLSTQESYLPIAIISILFFLLQFLLTLMNVHIADILRVLNISSRRVIQLQATYYTGYFVGPLFISRFTFAKFSLHVTLLTGLLIFSTAPMFFWPTAVLLTIPGLIVSYFVLGLGFSVVYNAIFVFISLCGPFQYAVPRFLFLHGVGNLGELLSFILASQYIFPENPTETTILNSQWTFLGVTLFVVFLTVTLYYIPLPGVSYDDLTQNAEYIAGVRQIIMSPNKAYVCNWDVVYTTLALGVFSAFCYSGFNSVTAYIFTDYVQSMDPTPGLNGRHILWIAGAVHVISQLVAASICCYVRPSWVLLSCCVINIILSILTLTVEGTAGVVVIVVLQIFAGPVFPLLLSLPLSRLGRYTFAASTYLTATLSAGALFVPVTYFVQKHPSANPIQYSFSVALACSCFGITMPLYLNISRAARKQVFVEKVER
ncbi:uncharacterized protein N7482_005811 [Penicillium canariense]|uniref:Rhodopsin domain-containing protein n=1 Tax=Penicillium canariense TaxID=189055 RepID=A0A9W9I5K4_9EURO|nr:uncharacterized protein N7482_005811 [Penicillium canariense]KAJ5167030.1 hypothetical protein N7482_005811 [Penicillium canariense]